MQDKLLKQRIERARHVLAEIHHVAIATVNADGTPHNSPVFMAFDERLNGFWASNPEALHSQNIARTGQVFLSIFDSREGHSGLCIRAEAEALENEADARHGYETLCALKEKFYGSMGQLESYIEPGPQRIYRARPLQFWVNVSDRDASGVIIRDRRHEAKVEDLLQVRP